MASSLPPGLDLSNFPLSPPPPGIASNFVDPTSLASLTLAVVVTLIVLTTLFVGIRLYTSIFIICSVGIEDYVCLIATVFAFAYMAIDLSLSDLAVHAWNFPLSKVDAPYLKKEFAQFEVLGFGLFTSKLSILLLYRRLFGPNNTLRKLVYFGIAFSACFYSLNFILGAYYCTPHGKEWNFLNWHCSELIPWGCVQGGVNILVDLFILWLPIPVVWKLNLPRKRKIGILAIFMTGTLAVMASIIGAYERVKLVNSTDYTWDQSYVYILIDVEISITIICSSMPACASFFKHTLIDSAYLASLRSRLVDRSKKTNGTSYGGSSSKESYHMQKLDSIGSHPRLPGKGNNYVELLERPTLGHARNPTESKVTAGDPESGMRHIDHGIIKSVGVQRTYD